MRHHINHADAKFTLLHQLPTDIVRKASPRLTVLLVVVSFAGLVWVSQSTFGYWRPRVPVAENLGVLLPVIELGGFFVALATIFKTRRAGDRGDHVRRKVDPLTGLPNRVALEEAFRSAISSGHPDSRHPVAALFIDVADLKLINDTFGYDVGDDVLVQVGTRLRNQVGGVGLVCRLGGNKFVVLSPRMDERTATVLAESICDLFREPVETLEHVLVDVSLSVGVAVYPHHGADPQSVLAGASDASRAAKRIGKNSVLALERATLSRNRENAELQTELRGALAAKQFVVHYQPIVNVATGCIDGAEALLRWDHPQRGMIRPGDFIELAERAGLMPAIGDWVLQEALTHAKTWIDHNERFRIAVNVSGSQLRGSGFGRRLRTLLDESGVPAKHLVLELTEHSLIDGRDSAFSELLAISQQGTGIAADDFGTGYSVMSYLNSLPLTAIKIDQHFITRATVDMRDRLIVEALIGLAHRLGLQVVAEYVEAVDQLEFLREAGCDLYQGYLYSAPLSAHAFHALLRDRDAIAA